MASTGITTDNVNLRSGAGTGNPVLEVIPKATTITILATAGDWLQVQSPGGTTGYVSAALVQQNAAGSPTVVVVSNKKLTFAGDILNVRSAPAIIDNPDNKIETLTAGASVQPLEDDASLSQKVGSTKDKGLWIKVQTPSGKQGFVAAWLVQYASPTPTPASSGQGSPPVQTVPPKQPPPTSQPKPTDRLLLAARRSSVAIIAANTNIY